MGSKRNLHTLKKNKRQGDKRQNSLPLNIKKER